MKTFKTEQEEFWAGDFGAEYSERNVGDKWIASNISLFSKIFSRTNSVNSLIEFGSNIGLNLKAIKTLLPEIKLSAIEINDAAVEELKSFNQGEINIYHKSILDFEPDNSWDFVLIKGVLIHINPDKLNDVYSKLYKSSKKYICLAEYYNPSPVAINYRGHSDKLFKRDFAGEMLEKYPELRLVDYGFVYHRDKHYPQDDITWFLMEKV